MNWGSKSSKRNVMSPAYWKTTASRSTEAWPGSIVGTHLAAALDYRQTPYRRPTLLVMGAERTGLREATAALCSDLVRIPMDGGADSLNLAVATAVMLFEIRRDELRLP